MSDYTSLSLGDRVLVDSHTKPLHREIEHLRAQVEESREAAKVFREVSDGYKARLAESKRALAEYKEQFRVDTKAIESAESKLAQAVQALKLIAKEPLLASDTNPPFMYRSEIAAKALDEIRTRTTGIALAAKGKGARPIGSVNVRMNMIERASTEESCAKGDKNG